MSSSSVKALTPANKTFLLPHNKNHKVIGDSAAAAVRTPQAESRLKKTVEKT